MALFYLAPNSSAIIFNGVQAGANFSYNAPGSSLTWSSYAYYDPSARLGLGTDKRLSARYRIFPWQRLTNIRIPEDAFFFLKKSRKRLNHSISSPRLLLARLPLMIRSTLSKGLMTA